MHNTLLFLFCFSFKKQIDLIEEKEKEMGRRLFLPHHHRRREKKSIDFFYSDPTRSQSWIWLGGETHELLGLK